MLRFRIPESLGYLARCNQEQPIDPRRNLQQVNPHQLRQHLPQLQSSLFQLRVALTHGRRCSPTNHRPTHCHQRRSQKHPPRQETRRNHRLNNPSRGNSL